MFSAAVFGPDRVFGKEKHEADQEHRKNELSHNFGTSFFKPMAQWSQFAYCRWNQLSVVLSVSDVNK